MAQNQMLVAMGYWAPLERNLVFRPLRGNLEVFIGKGLVQVAKLHADTFRTQVGIVSESQRGRLQLCMQQALQTETAGARPLGGAGRPAAPMSLQIDASKFGK